jgi:hypothetical protein
MMKKLIFLFFMVLVLLSCPVRGQAEDQEEWYRLLNNSSSINGPTGLFNIPTTFVVPPGGYSMGAHRYNFKYNAGLVKGLEAGLMFDAEKVEDFTAKALKQVVFNAKYNIVTEEDFPIGISAGVMNHEVYVVTSRYFPEFFNFAVHPGIKYNRDRKLQGFAGISKLNWKVLFITDVNDNSYSFGMRVLLYKKLNLDIALIKLEEIKKMGFDSIIFGINFAE